MNSETPRYTLRQSLSDCLGGIALIMCLDALMCLLLAGSGVPAAANAIGTGLVGPLACAVAVVTRWRQFR